MLLYSSDVENIISQCTLFGTKYLSVGSYFAFFQIFILQDLIRQMENRSTAGLIEIYIIVDIKR